MAKPISARQLTCIQALWSRRMHAAGVLDRAEARAMRHQYIQQLTAGRANETKKLSAADATLVIRSLRGARIEDGAPAHAAGTHGRRGHHDGREQVIIGAQQVALLAVLLGKLGWDQARLDAFVGRQIGAGRQIRTMADFNRVVWGMKSLIRQAERRQAEPQPGEIAAL